MAGQYVVVALPYSHLQPEAVGPFRSYDRAVAARDRVEAATGSIEEYGVAPQIVPLRTLENFVDEFGVAEEADRA